MNNRMDLLISYLVSGVLGEELPPRRVLDYANMKIRNYTDSDNYIKAGKFYFNQYKTKDRYGSQIISIPKELNTFINKWKQINEDSDYLLLNEDEKPFTSTATSLPFNVDTIYFVAYATTKDGKTQYGKVLTLPRTVQSPYTAKVWMTSNLGAITNLQYP
jgi:hypothetical protein